MAKSNKKKDIDDSIEEKNRVQKIKDHKKKFEKNFYQKKYNWHIKYIFFD